VVRVGTGKPVKDSTGPDTEEPAAPAPDA
jgi:hypothetical protein